MIGETNAGYTVTMAARVDTHVLIVLAEDDASDKFVVWTYDEAYPGYSDGDYTRSFTVAWDSFLCRTEHMLGLI